MSYTNNELAKAELEILEDHRLHEKLVNEEFKIWKKTVPLLYDTIHTFALDSPSLVFQWLPKFSYSNENQIITAKFLIGTNSIENSNATNGGSNYLKIGSVELPGSLAPDFTKPISKPTSLNADFSTSNFVFNLGWKQTSEVNKLSLSPDSSIVLSFNGDGVVHSYNLENNDVIDYKYHKQEGYALEWISNEVFLSGSNDSQIALWNINKPSTPIQLFKSHFGAVNDISTNSVVHEIFASVSDDYTTQIHDSRVSADDSIVLKIKNKYIQNAIKFNPNVQTFYATAGKDNVVNLYDLRSPDQPFRQLVGHNDNVIGLQWNNHDATSLTSWGSDKRVITWDLENLDEDFVYSPDSSNESSRKRSSNNNNNNKVDPCLKFIHAGHTNRINDVALHPVIKNLYGSVGDDNLLEIWQPKTLPVEEEEEEEEPEEEAPEEQEEPESQKSSTKDDTEASAPTSTITTKNDEPTAEEVAPTKASNDEDKKVAVDEKKSEDSTTDTTKDVEMTE
ncbi:putative histone acetyltransferase subunit [Scheffersomyces amazonensis]|uniref:putative histone acetyltransferase subunit n=1 Tax=Scheffersomyces amazonensis TaxID=1078765 RepID=UPI00315C6BC5